MFTQQIQMENTLLKNYRKWQKKIDVISFCDHNVLGAYEELKELKIED